MAEEKLRIFFKIARIVRTMNRIVSLHDLGLQLIPGDKLIIRDKIISPHKKMVDIVEAIYSSNALGSH